MPKYKEIKLDSNREHVIENGNYSFVYDTDAIMQNCENATRAQVGEYRYDFTFGVDYTGNVFSPSASYPVWERQVISSIRSVPGVSNAVVIEFDVDPSGSASYTVLIEHEFGNSNLSGRA